MLSEPGHQQTFRFKVADLLLLLACVAVPISLCISVEKLVGILYATRGLRSEIRIVDGVPDAVGIRYYRLDDGTILTNSQVSLLKVALVVQVLALVAIGIWGYRRFRLRSRLSIRSRLLVMLGMVLLCALVGSVPLDSMFVASVVYCSAWSVPGASIGFDLCRSRRGVVIGALIGALLGGLLLLWLMQPVARE